MGQLPYWTSFFRTLELVWALIGTIEFGKHTLNNSDVGGKLDYMPLVAITGVGIAFFLLSFAINGFGYYCSFTGLRQSESMRTIRVAVQCFDLFLWFSYIWIVFYLPKIVDIDADPESVQITDTLYWSNPWCIPTMMMAAVVLGLVIAETRHENKANGISGVYNDVALEHKGDFKSEATTDVKVADHAA